MKPKIEIPIDKKKCESCTKQKTCECFHSGKKMCPMICIECGKCMCHPERKDCCIEGHYMYNGDLMVCMDCWDKSKKIK